MSVDTWKSLNTQYKRNEVAVRTIHIKNVKFRIFKLWTGCQYVGYL